MPSCMMLVGLPGLGKTTLVREVFGKEGSDYFTYSADNQLEASAKVRGLTYDEYWSKETIKQATKDANADLANAISAGMNVVWDQTNLGVKKRMRVLRRMKQEGYVVECLAFLPPERGWIDDTKAWMERLRFRSENEGKTIPADVLRNMMNSFVVPTQDEGYDSVWYVNMWGKAVPYREWE